MRAALYGAGDPIITGLRRLAVLVRHLPQGSAIHRATDGAAVAAWDLHVELAAQTRDAVHQLLYVFVKANTKPGTIIPEPKRLPRPWEDTERDAAGERRRTSTPAAIAAFARSTGGKVIVTPPTSEPTKP